MPKRKRKRTWKDRKEERFKEENKVAIEWVNYKDPKRNNVIYAFTMDLSIGGAKILEKTIHFEKFKLFFTKILD